MCSSLNMTDTTLLNSSSLHPLSAMVLLELNPVLNSCLVEQIINVMDSFASPTCTWTCNHGLSCSYSRFKQTIELPPLRQFIFLLLEINRHYLNPHGKAENTWLNVCGRRGRVVFFFHLILNCVVLITVSSFPKQFLAFLVFAMFLNFINTCK